VTIAVNSVFNKNSAYAIGDIVTSGGVFYKCVTAVATSTSTAGNPTPDSSNSWKTQSTTAKAYSNTNSYLAGTIVIYDDQLYSCKTIISPAQATPDKNSNWEVYKKDLDSLFSFYPNPLAAKTTVAAGNNNELDADKEVSGDYIIHRVSGPQYSWNAGVQYNYFADDYLTVTSETSANKQFFFGTNWEVHSTGHLPNAANAALITTMEGYALDDHSSITLWTNWKTHLNKNRVSVAAHDTFTSQIGSIFDFGGYSNYNLGKRYVENTATRGGTTINRSDLTKDWCDKGGPTWTSLRLNSKDSDMFDNTPASDNTPGFDFSTYAEARVEKNIDSASYSYSQDSHRIDVTHECNTTEVRYGGIERVVRYNDDDYKVYEFMEENRVSDEWIYTEEAEKKRACPC
jgi:hypothetical protein